MNNPREFHLGDVLSITTGRLVSPSVMDGMYAICEHLAGEAVWTHQLPRVADEAKPALSRARGHRPFGRYPRQLARMACRTGGAVRRNESGPAAFRRRARKHRSAVGGG